MLTVNTQFEHELRKRINARLVAIAETLCDGTAIKDFADYRRYVGEFQGLKQVADTFCDEVNTILNKR